jgi:predicted acylesterase/phospholipase RssA
MTKSPEQEIDHPSGRSSFLSKIVKTVIVIGLLWVLACVWRQLGWRSFVWVALCAALVCALIAIAQRKIFKGLTHDMGLGASIGLAISAAFVLWTGRHFSDVVIIASSFAICSFLSRLLKIKLGWVFCIASWVLLSLYTPLFERHSEKQDPTRFEKITRRYPNLRIGVALSGGGYRAALFHAGVLSALDDIHIVPGNISSVSGGSITSAFYALGGKPADLLTAVQQGRLNLRRELASAQNTLRLPFPGQVPGTKLRLFPWYEFGGTNVQANLLDRVLYNGKRFGDLDKASAPELMLCATDLLTGRAIGLTSDATIEFRIFTPMEGTQPPSGWLAGSLFKDAPKVIPSNHSSELFPRQERISTLVAASGAFPLAFEPVVRNVHFQPPHKYDNAQDHTYRFADGGITDNSGLTLMLTAQNLANLAALNSDLFKDETTRLVQDWDLDFIIASDASSFFSCKDPREPGFDPARALDIVYSRVQMREPTFLRSQYKFRQVRIIVLSPQTLVPDSCAFPDIYVKDASREILSCLDEEGFRAILFEYPNEVERLLEQRRKEKSTLKANESQTDDCSAGNFRTNADVEAHILVNKKIKEDVETFLKTDTLDDLISPDDAARLYNLGRYLVLLKFGEIQHEAQLRGHVKDSGPVPVAPQKP